jgi:hypothetical protein
MASKVPFYAPAGNQTSITNRALRESVPGVDVVKDQNLKTPQDDNPWDIVILTPALVNSDLDNLAKTEMNLGMAGQIVLPGIASVSIDTTYDFEITRLKNKTTFPPKVVPLGMNLRRATIELLLTSEDEFNKYVEVINNVVVLGQAPVPYGVDHPNIKIYKPNWWYIESISSPQPNARDGWNITIRLLEYSDTKEAKPQPKQNMKEATPQKQGETKAANSSPGK